MKVKSLAGGFGSILALCITLGGAIPSVAHARNSELVASASIPMKVDCPQTLSTPQGRRAAIKYGLCGYGTHGITPDASVSGDCGTLTYLLFNNGNGTATSLVQISTNFGPIIYATYSANWNNATWYISGSYGASTGPTGSPWNSYKTLDTYQGSVVGDLTSAYDVTLYGPICYGATPLFTGVFVTG